MINWTIGQLGLGEAQVLGMGPQGTSKDKGASARLEADHSLESASPVLFRFVQFSADFERKKKKRKKKAFRASFFSLRQLDAFASFSVSHFAKAYGCMCKNSSDA